ncbi:DUF308 domain-containing protein [Breznakiella homolactica]|uniref:DUF308 domain-containing protein n=1 Tax=Breznakiella homolactica TaxID=2798577 RepID=A0A7T8BBN2_9SPIR|nr:DUF308 domain-containing protein [Breznakiella homolactica]QQO10250.1 DUF308 domain-containing protein [Breznakiella homolactica]
MSRTTVIMCAVFVLLGLVMLFSPSGFVSALVVGIGIAAVINGILNLVNVRTLVNDKAFQRAIIIRAVVSIIVGLIAIIAPLAFAGTVWTVVIYIIAAELVISAGLELYGVWKMRNAGVAFGPYVIEAIITILLAVVLFIIPATIGLTVVRILGGIIIAAGIVGFIWALRTPKDPVPPGV